MMIKRAAFGAWFRAPAILLLAIGLILALPFPQSALAQEAEYSRFSMEVRGEGPDVILIPGLSTPRDVWQPTADLLQNRYRLHLMQVRGFGEDAGVNGEGPILDDLVAELAAYIDQQELERPAIIGHSLGGLTALMLAADHPDLPGKLLIVDALPWYAAVFAPGQQLSMEMVEPQADMMRAQLLAQAGQPMDAETLAANVANQSISPEGRAQIAAWAGAADQRVTAQLIYEDLTNDMREHIARITVPVEVLTPFADPFPTQEIAAQLYTNEYAALEGVEVTTMGPSRHFIMLDMPQEFQQKVEGFLTR